jgi:hypothetical protein
MRDIEQRIYEQAASEIGGVASHLSALIVERPWIGVIVKISMDEAAKSLEHQNIVLRQQPSLTEVHTHLEVDGLEVAVEVVFVGPAIGRDVLAVLPVEPIA